MLRLLKFTFSLAVLAIVVYFAATVKLGDRTLLGHLHAIYASPAGQDLKNGVVEKTEQTEQRIRNDLADSPAQDSPAPRPPERRAPPRR